LFFESLLHTEYDHYWKTPWHSAELYYDEFADVPVLFETGWYDHYTENVCRLYEGLSKKKKGPIKLIVGPWTHGGTSLTYAGEVEFGPNAPLNVSIAPSYNQLRLRWFNRWLKDIKNGAEKDPAVRIFTMGGGSGRRRYRFMQHGGKWRNELDWPLPNTNYTKYYFTEQGDLTPTIPEIENSFTTYTFDPRNPVPSIGGQREPHYMLGGEYRNLEGAFDQVERKEFFCSKTPYLPLTFRNDVLVFKTPPLSEPIEVTGPIKVKIWASSTAVDTDFTAKLIDWYPPNIDYPLGFAMNLTDGIIRARYRDSWEKSKLMNPHENYPFEITLYPTSNLFNINHRIRVDISSSNYPRFDVNPNTGDPLGRSRRFTFADNTIYHDVKHPSHVILPIINGDR
jgi:putative CocE/NonD family hydrolase